MICMADFSSVIFRWSLGQQNTVSLSSYKSQDFLDYLWLAKLSILSFQKHFPGAEFVVLYNGHSFHEFLPLFDEVDLKLSAPVRFVNQRDIAGLCKSYEFAPTGVWWKWIPFRLDIKKTEIAVDSDIFCINTPHTWYEWIENDRPILLAPERYEKVLPNTCGDFAKHPVIKNQEPVNCGVVGQKMGHNYEDRFFEIASHVKLGHTHDSLFISEQGVINLWMRSLENDGVKNTILQFDKNAWIRDFLYFMGNDVVVETVHAVSWYKKIVKALAVPFVSKIVDDSYQTIDFISDIFKTATSHNFLKEEGLGQVSRFLIGRQFGSSENMDVEFYLSRK